jgi:hypothetical protein
MLVAMQHESSVTSLKSEVKSPWKMSLYTSFGGWCDLVTNALGYV